jgi:hypothetical protein
VRSPHLDRPNKLFNALLYCRVPGDETPGGELILYRRRGPLVYSRGSAIMPTRIVEAKRVAYRANRLVLFLSSPWSVHGVAPRGCTSYLRRYLNFMCEYRDPLFEVQQLPRHKQILERTGAAISRPFSGSVAPDVEDV